MKVLISKKALPIGKPLSFSLHSIARVSAYLDEETTKLPKYLYELSDEEFYKYLENHKPNYPSSKVAVFKAAFMMVVGKEKEWEILLKAYFVEKSLDKSTALSRAEQFIVEVNQTLYLYYSKVERFIIELKEARNSLIQLRKPIFDYQEFLKEFNKIPGSRASTWGSKVVCEVAKDIHFTSELDDEVDITYQSILIYLDGYEIDSFVLRFEHFDYFSKWETPTVILHPFLDIPYGYNHSLYFLPRSEKLYAKMIYETMVPQDDTPFRNLDRLSTIKESYNTARRIWNGMKYKSLSRQKLSEEIFNSGVWED